MTERELELRRLLKECVKVMDANSVFRGTPAHRELKARIKEAIAARKREGD